VQAANSLRHTKRCLLSLQAMTSSRTPPGVERHQLRPGEQSEDDNAQTRWGSDAYLGWLVRDSMELWKCPATSGHSWWTCI
jgi:hypothetical protein